MKRLHPSGPLMEQPEKYTLNEIMQIENIEQKGKHHLSLFYKSLTNTRVWNCLEGGCLQSSLACITCCKPWTWTVGIILNSCYKETFLL